MSVPDIVAGDYVSVLVEDQANPGTFIPFCGMTTKTLTEQVQTRDRYLKDCAQPESIPFRHLVATGKQWDMSASGLYNRAQAALVSSAVGKKWNYRFLIGEPADDEVYSSYFGGTAMLVQRQIGGAEGDDATAELTWASHGEWTETVL